MKRGLTLLLAIIALSALGCDSSGGGGATDTVVQTDLGGSGTDVAGGEDTFVATPDLGCIPSCAGRQCGDNGCGSTCGTCGEGFACTPAGSCVCEKQCEGRECGPDGCEGECGRCGLGFVCDDASFLCEPGGDISCASYFVCVDSCAGDTECEADCGEARAEDVVALTDTLSACFATSCDTCADMACLQSCGRDNCGSDFVTCFSGDGACFEILACVRTCQVQHVYGEPSYDACRLDCVAIGSAVEQDKYLALEVCVDEVCERNQPPADYQVCERSAMGRECQGQSVQCPQF